MHFFKAHRPSWIAHAAALLGAVLAISATKIANFDIWWHLKTGGVISQWMSIPSHDIYSYTIPGAPWVNHEWLFQVIAWLAYSGGGLAALTLMKFVLTTGIAYISFRAFMLLTSSRSAALWGTLILLWGLADRIMARPFLFTYFFVALFCLKLHRFEGGQKGTLWELPFLTVPWINLHGGGLLAPQLVLAFALGVSLHALLGAPGPLPPGKLRRLWLTGFLCLAACAINPNGLEVFLFPLRHLNMPSILAFTQEWLSPFDPRLDWLISQNAFRISLATVLVSYIMNLRNARLSHLMLTVLTSILVLKGKRFTSHFLIVNIPLIFFNFKGLASRVPLTPGAGYMHEWGNVIAVAMLSLLAVVRGVPLDPRGASSEPIGIGTSFRFAPAQMVDFLDQHGICGKVFNDMSIGGYLIFRRWPAERVFIDGRTPVYGDDFYRAYVDAFRNHRNFEELDGRWRFDYLVFKSEGAWDFRQLHKYLWENPTWRLVYFQRDGMIYLRDSPRFKKLIEKLEPARHPLVDAMEKAEDG